MNCFESMAIRYCGDELEILDQTQLPDQEIWVKIQSLEAMYEAIHSLRVRGAPLIGVSAALFLAQYLNQGASLKDFERASEHLRGSRPTAVNLMYAIDRLKKVARETESSSAIIEDAYLQLEEDQTLCKRIGKHGASLIESGDGVLHHCNTGGLATAGIGTALGVIQTAYDQGKKFHVYVDETRPLLQGGRLTAWELEKLGIPYTLICDNMAAALMRDKKINKAIVGSDRIAMNGDFANKTGTYSVAVQCSHHKIPFYTAAPVTTLDFQCKSGNEIPIELRSSGEILGARGAFGSIRWAPRSAAVYNPAFDVTPANLVSGWILDTGYYNSEDVSKGVFLSLNSHQHLELE